jgi:hypothetical protein
LNVTLNGDQEAMLAGGRGRARQMAMRLLLDLAAAAGATGFVPIRSAHLAGVSPLTGGLGLRQFLARLASDPEARFAVPTTLNAAGCDANQFEAMLIAVPDFLEQSVEIVDLYTRLGARPIQSCVPYEWDGVTADGPAAWSESNAICFGNSFCTLRTNRESGLSALACALTGYTPDYGLLQEEARRPNLEVIVTAPVDDPADFSVLGDWIGKQVRPGWRLPYGPIPLIHGLPAELSHEQRKALAAAAANYGAPLVYVAGEGDIPAPAPFEATVTFGPAELAQRYAQLRPRGPVSLIVIGCPQASLGEVRAAAELLRGKQVTAAPDDPAGWPPLWIFTSAQTKAIAERTGLARVVQESGALLLENTCPEVVPYDPRWVRQILTNSMKAEHYLKSGLNRIPAAVMHLAACVAVATGELELSAEAPAEPEVAGPAIPAAPPAVAPSRPARFLAADFSATGRGLPSQGDFTVTGPAFVTDRPITFLGFVNRETGVVEEPGHPAHGRSLAGTIALFPRATGSTVAPYVLLELYYRGKAPLAIVNTEIDQQSAPACSLEGIPYAFDFDPLIFEQVRDGDLIELARRGETVTLRPVKSAAAA